MDKKDVRRRDIYCQYAFEAARQAISDSGSDFKDCNPFRLGVYIGSGIGGIHTGIEPEKIDYLSAHGISTPANDNYETKAIKRAFQENSEKLLISSTKSMTGHLLGAAGAIEAIACAMALKNSFVPMTVGYKE